MSALWSEPLHPEVVRACNHIQGADVLPAIEGDGGPWRVTAIDPTDRARADFRVEVRLGRWSAIAGLDAPSRWGAIGAIAWPTIAAPLRATILGDLLRPLLDWLTALTGEPAAIDSTGTADRDDTTLPVLIVFQGADAGERRMTLALPAEGWRFVADRLSRASPGVRSMSMPLRLRIELPSQTLRRDEAAAVRPGDMIRIHTSVDASGRPLRLNLVLGRRVLFHCRLNGADLAVERVPADSGSASMSKDNAVKNLDQLELPVSFQLGSLSVSLEELSRIGPGHTFTTHLATTQPMVSILVDGQKVGSGRLTAVGDLVGVQVLDWV